MLIKEAIDVGETDTQKVIGFLGSGEEVFISSQSHYFTHPDTHEALGFALGKIYSDSLLVDSNGIAHVEVKIDGVEGSSICVPITDDDLFVYAIRRPRTWYTRFVIGREVIRTSIMTVVLKGDNHKFELCTAYWGPRAQREPSDPSLALGTPEYETSENFWRYRALVLPSDESAMIALGVDPQLIKESLVEGEAYLRA
ncbi:MAG: hypothetical protein UW41_C0003G0008 [Candidatus Collierbacteria bacterium GW2011_GWC2_44_18]|uniref:Uncharacterized protein n=2 Tax=Microgenomates group TaxID=1794810 RepID=A0A0G1J7C4_9BACT|nr:MAG: hypothetical protein UW16_C0006G0006 [Microgenomates group bacterium GW2011_GWC1_44_10]KKT49641.1 MAG: hypothetical protein UW41_C0003G0008 [Candidatus Collierbacteria bacterium GW2011_GWC2_44_18]KKT67248.1 MAG: hypothetical protein UW60_C0010G0011 [Candidatus Woesebacteria bacterium GW2011_GWA2_44_33]